MTDRRTFIATLAGLPLLASLETRAQTQRFAKPVVVSTWDSGIRANAAAWKVLEKGGRALDGVERAARQAEDEASCCVGLAALPDRDGFVTLDACIMDERANCGAVSFMQRIKHPISVARKLMETTPHVMLSGEGATRFAVENGFALESGVLSPESEKAWKEWLKKSEYRPKVNIENQKPGGVSQFAPYFFDDGSPNHDTMGTIAMDAKGDLSGAVTTSGMAYKIHGRVGDSPIIGAGLFVDNKVGAATSSGVGEEVIRICGTHTVIEQMRAGRSPEHACREAVRRVVERDPAKARALQVGFVAISKSGEVGAFAVQKGFTYSVTNNDLPTGKVFQSKSYL
jgi:N4-(beta-N-acetylglucosaminyl)-L-asparaginase